MIKFNFSLLCILLTTSSYSQEGILLQGKIHTDSLEDSSIHIININSQAGTTNSSLGNFEIRVRENDILLFSSVQFKNEEIVITKEIIDEGFLNVNLTSLVNELEEVKISDIKLSGNLARDLPSLETINKYNLGVPLSTKPPPTQEDRRLYTATHSAGGIVSFDLILNVISGRLKKLKNEKEIGDFRRLVYRAIEFLPPSFYSEELGLNEEEVINFVYFCAENEIFQALVRSENQLAVIEFYQNNILAFRKLGVD